MQALLVEAHGGLEALVIQDRARPEPRPDEVLVRVAAAGVNHLDLWVRRGVEGHRFPLPLVLGSDGAGTVEEVGSVVTGVSPGDRVVIAPGVSCNRCDACLSGDQNLCPGYGILGETRDGTCAEYVAVPGTNILPCPEQLSFEDAASIPLAALTAHHMLVSRSGIRPGMDVLIHAAGSGVSMNAIQIARIHGARVIVTASSQAKLERARDLGADVLIDYSEADWPRRVWEATGKRGVDIVVDHVGQATFAKSLRCLKPGGSVVTCGATTGPELQADLRPIFFKNLAILGSTMGGLGELRHVWRLVERGLIRPIVDRVLPLSEAAEAHRALEAREAFGKIVLIPGA